MSLSNYLFSPTHAVWRRWLAVWLALSISSSALAQVGGEDPGNQYSRYSNAELEAVCDAMSPSRFVSGLTEGAWVAMPGAGKTYFYRSACYLELVRRTGRVELCAKVVERRTLLGDGSSHTPQSCKQLATAYQTRQAQSTQDQATDARSMEGVFKISKLQVKALPSGNWRLDVQADGQRKGDYVLRVYQVRENRLLLKEAHALNHASSWTWELSRATIVGTTALPNIFPMAVSLSYRLPSAAAGSATERITHIQNFTLSVE